LQKSFISTKFSSSSISKIKLLPAEYWLFTTISQNAKFKKE